VGDDVDDRGWGGIAAERTSVTGGIIAYGGDVLLRAMKRANKMTVKTASMRRMAISGLRARQISRQSSGGLALA
jgi:hypothetical protein